MEKFLLLSQKSQETQLPRISEAWLWLIIPGEEQKVSSLQRVGGSGSWNPESSDGGLLHESPAAAVAAAALCIA